MYIIFFNYGSRERERERETRISNIIIFNFMQLLTVSKLYTELL